MREYRDSPQDFAAPSEAELRARGRRNIAIALTLVGFMAAVFLGMLARAGYL